MRRFCMKPMRKVRNGNAPSHAPPPLSGAGGWGMRVMDDTNLETQFPRFAVLDEMLDWYWKEVKKSPFTPPWLKVESDRWNQIIHSTNAETK